MSTDSRTRGQDLRTPLTPLCTARRTLLVHVSVPVDVVMLVLVLKS
jgi:hypothetical protein